ncbi:N-acetylmuramoyl-L-alanine amidase [Ovoidimarina sediminis]|uniref:N-acetylmuramoyl-L-alanine amidase n=1 Tax=Ovoidimarina sediminis TaxID=3079856 RepID=UPI002907CD41|nr:N-acetylmuramoyl-L-alanine amidase [Rhodophyticola sp. MJ-SS7]MDU8945053.1 N-acetylmuramoyl-L-alanine amidase [Rhodophyticola sp. MJ-SS7]
MSRLTLLLPALCAFLLLAAPAQATPLGALARVSGSDSAVSDAGQGLDLSLALSQPVPWRAYTLDAPRRLVIDLAEVTWPGEIPVTSRRDLALSTGTARPGWSRLVLTLDAPLAIDRAELDTSAPDGRARLSVSLGPVDEATFAARAQAAPDLALPAATPDGARPVIVLDPGHGGIDPGAVAGGLVEADLMLTFARELRGILRATGAFDVVLTRDADVFVPLETRITRARQAGATVLISLHADALPPDAGHASGATVYTLAEEASDIASQRLAERHDEDDLIAGVDLGGQGDEIALVLMDLARTVTQPRTDALADTLVGAIDAGTGATNSNPRRAAAFSVLKAPDFPSVLIELGFLSSEADRKRLSDGRARMALARAIADGLLDWTAKDRTLAARLK